MTGWLILAGLAVLAMLLLWWPGRLDRPALMLAASALFVAAAGYAWQGSPDKPGAPFHRPEQHGMKPDTLFSSERMRFLNKYGEAGQWLGTADAMNRLGEDDLAVAFMRGAVKKYPNNPDMWIGYGHALFMLADGNMTPAVLLAFDRAQALAPASPAPRYFRGLTELESGNAGAAEQEWRALYASLPEDSIWRKPLGDRLGMFDVLRASRAQAQTAH